MRRLFLILAALFALPLLGTDSPKDYDGATVAALDGTWMPIDYEEQGKKEHSDEQDLGYAWNFRCGIFAYRKPWTIQQRYRLDPSQNPAHLDLNPDHEEVLRFIYQINGDILRIGIGADNTRRPQGFNDAGLTIVTFKRVK
jgi:uncharacterized protein (TIGR03067 family)